MSVTRRLRVARKAEGSPAGPGPDTAGDHDGQGPETWLALVARGDTAAFERLYDALAPEVYGLCLQVLRDPTQAEEVAQEVLVEVWQTASRFDPARGSARTWVLTMSRRRAIDRVRSSQARNDRDQRMALRSTTRDHDEVSEAVEIRLEQEQVRRCLEGLTDLQRESLTLAYYRGYTHREVAAVLDVPVGTVKTRLRDGLIRLRDCLGVTR